MKFKDLSLPGTHNTMALKDHTSTRSRCQSVSLRGQLESGIRALDVRCRIENDWCYLHHGTESLGFLLGNDVLNPIKTYLSANPS